MKILAIETSTEACSAALLIDGEVHEQYRVAPREHAELILQMAEDLLAEASTPLSALDALAFGRGPGAFTGVRIGTGVIQGIAFAADLPVVPVSTLAALAHGAYRDTGETRILAAIDARMAEVYVAAYRFEEGRLEAEFAEQLCSPMQVPPVSAGQWFGAGSGWLSYEPELSQRLGPAVSAWEGERFPRAHDVALLGAGGFTEGLAVTAEQALPVYLRDNVTYQTKAPAN